MRKDCMDEIREIREALRPKNEKLELIKAFSRSLAYYSATFTPPLSAIYRFIKSTIEFYAEHTISFTSSEREALPTIYLYGVRELAFWFFYELRKYGSLEELRESYSKRLYIQSIELIKTSEDLSKSNFYDLYRKYRCMITDKMYDWENLILEKEMYKEDEEIEKMLEEEIKKFLNRN